MLLVGLLRQPHRVVVRLRPLLLLPRLVLDPLLVLLVPGHQFPQPVLVHPVPLLLVLLGEVVLLAEVESLLFGRVLPRLGGGLDHGEICPFEAFGPGGILAGNVVG